MQDETTTTTAPASDLRLAKEQADGFGYEANRVAVALRSLGNVIYNDDYPLSPGDVAGLCEAVQLVGEHLEWYAHDQKALLKGLEASRQGGAA